MRTAPCATLCLAIAGLYPAGAEAQRLDDVIEWMPDLVLEETDQTYIAHLSIRADPMGGWIAWDTQLNEVRLYASDGRLRASFGREGGGPGEFQGITSVVRLEDGRLVTLDRRGRFSIWDAAGSEVQRDFSALVPRPFGMVVGRADTVIVASPPFAPDAGADTKLLHRVSLDAEEVVSSFFDVPVPPAQFPLVATVLSAPPTRTPTGLAVSLSILDSIWLLPADAPGPITRISVPAELLDGLRADRSDLADTPALRDWVESNAFLGQVFPRADGGWLAQVWGFDGEPWSGVVALGADGALEWEVERSPLLVWYDSQTDLAYFWDANGLEPGRLQVGRLR